MPSWLELCRVTVFSTLPVSGTPTISNSTVADTSTDTSTNSTSIHSGTPTGALFVPERERGGTNMGPPAATSASTPTDTSQHTETGDVDLDRGNNAEEHSPSLE